MESLPEVGIKKTEETVTVYVENIKCGGCENTITKEMQSLGLIDVVVSHEESTVEFNADCSDDDILKAVKSLRGLGYPIVDSEEGLKAMILKAKSYASCAIGKLDK